MHFFEVGQQYGLQNFSVFENDYKELIKKQKH